MLNTACLLKNYQNAGLLETIYQIYGFLYPPETYHYQNFIVELNFWNPILNSVIIHKWKSETLPVL